MNKKIWGLAGLCAILSTTTADLALAQAVDIATKARPEYDARGLPVGGFIVYPQLRLGMAYDTNVFATDLNEEGDGTGIVDTTVNVNSDWNRHALNFRAFSQSRFFFQEDEDNTEYGFDGDGRLDVRRFTPLTYGGGWAERREQRASIDAPGAAADPVQFNQIKGNVGLHHRFNRLRVGTDFNIERFDYDDVDAIGGGIIDQDFRDRRQWKVIPRVGYEISPGYSVFVKGEYINVNYDLERNDAGLIGSAGGNFDRDNSGWTVESGVAFELTNLLSGELSAGYLKTNFEDPNLSDIKGYTIGSSLLWNPTSLTSVQLNADRETRGATTPGAGGRLTTDINVKVDHEFLRNLILTGQVGYTRARFDGIGRQDNTYSVGAAARYLVNRNAYVQLGAEYGTRDSNITMPSVDFDRTLVEITLVLQL